MNPRLARPGEEIGGGYFVFRRGKRTNRIRPPAFYSFEHPSLESALAEANRLAADRPGETFAVFAQAGKAMVEPTPDAFDAALASDTCGSTTGCS